MRNPDLLRLITGFVLLAVMGVTSCGDTTQRKNNPLSNSENRVIGEYIIATERGDAEEIIRQLYSEYSVHSVEALGRRRFLFKLENDPGSGVITERASRSPDVKWIQPNYKYQLQ